MTERIVRLDGGRLTIHIEPDIHIAGSRIGLCAPNEWKFPFEDKAVLSDWERWEDPIGVGQHLCATAPETTEGLAAELHVAVYDAHPLCRIWVTLCNDSTKPVRLRGIHLLDIAAAEGGSLDSGIPANEAVLYTDSGTGHHAGVSRLLEQTPDYEEKWTHHSPPKSRARMLALTGDRELGAGDHNSPSGLVVFAGDSESKGALLAGYVPVQRALSTILCRATEARGLEFLAAASGLYGYELQPKATYVSEDLLVGGFPNGLEALRVYAEASAALRGISVKKNPTSGWTSWYGYRLEATDEKIVANAKIIADRFLPYGMDIVLPDYSWQGNFLCNEWRQPNEHFPHGLAWLGDEIRKMGLRMGFWMAPLTVSSQSDSFAQLSAKHLDYLLKDESGRLVSLNWPWAAQEPAYILDPTVPGAMDDPMEQIAFLRRTTGADYWKIDFLCILLFLADKPQFADPSLVPGIEPYRAAIKALRRVAKDEFLYLQESEAPERF